MAQPGKTSRRFSLQRQINISARVSKAMNKVSPRLLFIPVCTTGSRGLLPAPTHNQSLQYRLVRSPLRRSGNSLLVRETLRHFNHWLRVSQALPGSPSLASSKPLLFRHRRPGGKRPYPFCHTKPGGKAFRQSVTRYLQHLLRRVCSPDMHQISFQLDSKACHLYLPLSNMRQRTGLLLTQILVPARCQNCPHKSTRLRDLSRLRSLRARKVSLCWQRWSACSWPWQS